MATILTAEASERNRDTAVYEAQAIGEARESPRYRYKTAVMKLYGLSKSWMDRLGEPDKFVPNPHYMSGPMSSLYRVERDEEFLEAHADEYARHLVQRENRSQASKKAAPLRYDRRAEERWLREAEIERWAKDVSIDLRPLPADLRAACAEHRKRLAEQYWWHVRPGDREFFTVTERRVSAMIRHEFTNYEWLLAELARRSGIGRDEIDTTGAYLTIKGRVNRLIEEAMGWGSEEGEEGVIPGASAAATATAEG